MMGEYWLALAAAMILLAPALFSDKSPLRLLFGPPKNYPDFKLIGVSWQLILGLIIATIVALAATQFWLNRIEGEFEDHKTNVDAERTRVAAEKAASEKAEKLAAEQRAELARIEREQREANEKAEREQRALAAGLKSVEETVARLKADGFKDVRIVKNTPTLRITQGIKRLQVGELEANEVRVEADNQYGTKKAVLVFHVFENSALWKYDSANSFERWSGTGVSVVGEINRSTELRRKLTTYDMIVGIGLGSNSPSQPARTSRDRAAFLCGALQSYRGDQAEVYGLSIGTFTGRERDTESSPKKMQRVVAMVGVIKQQQTVPDNALIQEIMVSVQGSGLDLAKYSLLKPGQQPQWLAVQDCKPT